MFCASGCWCSSTHGKHTTTSRIYETLCYFLELMRASIFPMWFSCVHNQPFVLLRFHGWEQSQLESVHEKKREKHLGTLGDRDATVTHPWYGYTLPWNGYTLPWNDHTLPWRMPPPKSPQNWVEFEKNRKSNWGCLLMFSTCLGFPTIGSQVGQCSIQQKHNNELYHIYHVFDVMSISSISFRPLGFVGVPVVYYCEPS